MCNHLWGIKTKNPYYGEVWVRDASGTFINHQSLKYMLAFLDFFEQEQTRLQHRLQQNGDSWVECFECGEKHSVGTNE